MNILDENLAAQQCIKLQEWRIQFRQIGRHLALRGTLDENVITVLHGLSQPTFFTHDKDFFKAPLCHSHYAIFYLDVSDALAAEFIRRVLKHPHFDTNAKRLGTVARVQSGGVQFWRKGRPGSQFADWPE